MSDETSNQTACAICLETIPDKSRNFVATECGHEFHARCFANHIRNRCENFEFDVQCPLCRGELTDAPAATVDRSSIQGVQFTLITPAEIRARRASDAINLNELDTAMLHNRPMRSAAGNVGGFSIVRETSDGRQRTIRFSTMPSPAELLENLRQMHVSRAGLYATVTGLDNYYFRHFRRGQERK